MGNNERSAISVTYEDNILPSGVNIRYSIILSVLRRRFPRNLTVAD